MIEGGLFIKSIDDAPYTESIDWPRFNTDNTGDDESLESTKKTAVCPKCGAQHNNPITANGYLTLCFGGTLKGDLGDGLMETVHLDTPFVFHTDSRGESIKEISTFRKAEAIKALVGEGKLTSATLSYILKTNCL